MIIAFDLDGTIIDSEETKLSAFASLFIGCPEYETIKKYNAAHRGIPRRVKFEYICHNILSVPSVEYEVDTYLRQYAATLTETMVGCSLIPGFSNFAEQLNCKKYVASSAPQQEIENLLERLQIREMFDDTFGYPVTKSNVLSDLMLSNEPVLFFGDALADYYAAIDNEVHFIGLASETNPDVFKGLKIETIRDYLDIEKVNKMIKEELHNKHI